MRDFLWRIKYNERIENGDSYLALSWSWISAAYPVLYHFGYVHRFGDAIVEITDGKVQHAGTNDKGKLSGGFLKIRGRIQWIVPGYSTGEGSQNTEITLERTYCIEGRASLSMYWDRRTEIGVHWAVAVLLFTQDADGQRALGLALRKTNVGGVYRRAGLAYFPREAFLEDVDPVEIVII